MTNDPVSGFGLPGFLQGVAWVGVRVRSRRDAVTRSLLLEVRGYLWCREAGHSRFALDEKSINDGIMSTAMQEGNRSKWVIGRNLAASLV